MSNALETIILAITHMKKMKVKYIIGKANTYIKKEILLKIGADKVVLPEISTAIRLADKITHPTILEKYDLDAKNSLLEVEIPNKFIGKTLSELDLRRKHGINVVMKKDKSRTEVISNPNIEFIQGDIVFVIGSATVIEKVFMEKN
jgi:trk system potassium uptake protein TrkA